MRYLDVEHVLRIHRRLVEKTGGDPGVRDPNLLDSAVAQPRMTFGGADLYPTLAEKAAALAFSLSGNHPFADGNKRTAHAAMEMFLLRNGHEIEATTDEQERVFLDLAAGRLTREALVSWIGDHLVARRPRG